MSASNASNVHKFNAVDPILKPGRDQYLKDNPEENGGYVAPAEEAEAVLPDIGKLRKQKMGGIARAGGAMRSGNEADLLGYVEPVRRKSASRMLLG